MKDYHQSRASYASWVNPNGLKRSAGDLYIPFSQNWRRCEWNPARGKSMLTKLVRPNSFIIHLHIGNKATLAVSDFIACTLSIGNEMVISLVSNVRPRCWFSTKSNLCNREATLCPSILACIWDSARMRASSWHRNRVITIFQQWREMCL